MTNEILFYESQRKLPLWIYGILLAMDGILAFSIVNNRATLHEMNSVDLWPLIIALGIIVLVHLLILTVKLETIIDSGGIKYRFYPFHRGFRNIAFDNVEKCYVRKYRPIIEFGGWGIRGFRSNRAYNLSGNYGLQLVLENGHKILLGTLKPALLNEILDKNRLLK